MINKDLFKYSSILILVCWLTIFVIVPNLGVLAISFLEKGEMNFVKFAFTLDNYKKLSSLMYIKVFVKTFEFLELCLLRMFS